MMNERLLYFAVGCVIGIVLGYIVRTYQDNKVSAKEEDTPMLTLKGTKDTGIIQSRLGTNLALFLVVALTAWAAFSSQISSNKFQDSQRNSQKIVDCNQAYLAATIVALNARTSNTQAQNDANVALQKAQATFLGIFFVSPPPTNDQRVAALQTYVAALTDFTSTSAKTSSNVIQNPYPSAVDFTNCVKGK